MASDTAASPAFDRLHDDLHDEYTKLVDIVHGFDQRLLTIKGWGVTLSLASLGFGFQQGHYGLFLVAAASGFAFWLLEAYTKDHQLHYYPRMRDIEVTTHRLFGVTTPSGKVSAPLIDWGWKTAGPRLRTGKSEDDPQVPQEWSDSVRPWFFLHVMFPHVVAIVVGTILFILGLFGVFGPI